MKPASQIILFSALLVFLFGCKKYPENTLWFKNPEKTGPFTGHLVEYNVNGIDSLELLNSYIPNYPGVNKDIRKCEFNSYEDSGNKSASVFVVAYIGSVPVKYTFTDNKKFIHISNRVDTTIFSKNLFIDFDVKWKIMKLTRQGYFKIQTTLSNGNKYEITID